MAATPKRRGDPSRGGAPQPPDGPHPDDLAAVQAVGEKQAQPEGGGRRGEEAAGFAGQRRTSTAQPVRSRADLHRGDGESDEHEGRDQGDRTAKASRAEPGDDSDAGQAAAATQRSSTRSGARAGGGRPATPPRPPRRERGR